LKAERAVFGSEYLCAGNITRQEVGCELDSVEVTFNGFRQIFNGFGFRESRCALYEQMTIGEKSDKKAIYEALLAYNLLR
jgi:hypothetical protein